MSLLLNIPEDLCYEVLSDWLSEVKYWVGLDTAFTNSNSRIYFISTVSRLSNACNEPLYKSPSYYNWIFAKNIRLDVVELRDNSFKKKELLFSIRYDSIRTLKIYTRKTKNMNPIKEILSKCHLTQLDIQLSELLEVANLSSLKSIKLREKYSVNLTASLVLLKEQCCNLVRLDLDFVNVSECNYDLICEVIAKNPKLANINLIGDNSVLRAIGNHCSGMRNICLCSGSISLDVVAEVILKCPDIRSMAFNEFSFGIESGLLSLELGGSNVSNDEVLQFIKLLPNISTFVSHNNFDETFAVDLVKYSQNTLTAINVSNNLNLSFYSLKTIVHGCSKLVSLNCNALFSGDLKEIFSIPNGLEELYIIPSEIHLEVVLYIINMCSCLKSLHVCNVFKSTSKLDMWRALMREFSLMKREFKCSIVFITQKYELIRYENGKFFENLQNNDSEPDFGDELVDLFY